MLSCVEIEVRNRGYKKIGILGTKPVMESKFYSVITSAEVILPEGNLLEEVHKSYVDMATLGSANDQQRKVFESACNQFLKVNKVDAVMLGGTDLALVYHARNVDFKLVVSAEIHEQKLFNFVTQF